MNNSLKRVIHDVLRSTVQKSVNSYVSYGWNSAMRVSETLGYTTLNDDRVISTEVIYIMLDRELDNA